MEPTETPTDVSTEIPAAITPPPIPEGVLNTLKINAHMTGCAGESWPTDFSHLTQNSLFFNTTENGVYTISPNGDSANTFDTLIKIRQGNFKWVELLYDEETKQQSSCVVVDPKNELTEYPTGTDSIKDIIDVVTMVYLKFDYNDLISKQFVKDIKDTFTPSVIEGYLSCTVDPAFAELLTSKPEIVSNLYNALTLILFNSYAK